MTVFPSGRLLCHRDDTHVTIGAYCSATVKIGTKEDIMSGRYYREI